MEFASCLSLLQDFFHKKMPFHVSDWGPSKPKLCLQTFCNIYIENTNQNFTHLEMWEFILFLFLPPCLLPLPPLVLCLSFFFPSPFTTFCVEYMFDAGFHWSIAFTYKSAQVTSVQLCQSPKITLLCNSIQVKKCNVTPARQPSQRKYSPKTQYLCPFPRTCGAGFCVWLLLLSLLFVRLAHITAHQRGSSLSWFYSFHCVHGLFCRCSHNICVYLMWPTPLIWATDIMTPFLSQ